MEPEKIRRELFDVCTICGGWLPDPDIRHDVSLNPIRMLMRIGTFLLFLLTSSLPGQVSIQLSPEPMEVLAALHVRGVGLWTLRVCNDSSSATLVAPERILMAVPSVRILDSSRAEAVLAAARGRNWRVQAATYISLGALMATALTGWGAIAAQPAVIAALGVGSGAARLVADELGRNAPDLGPYTGSLLETPIALSAGQCATRTVFAGKMKNPVSISAVLK